MAIIVCYVNGYGATDNLADGNYGRYLSSVIGYLRRTHPQDAIALYLSGGYTNRTDLTEAESMRRILEHQGIISGTDLTITRLETPYTAREGLQTLRERVGSATRVTIFCEYSRQWTMRFFARQLFARATVIGIPFDASSMKLAHRLKQIFFHLPLEAGAWHSAFIDRLRKQLRDRHVAKARSRSAE